MAKPPMRTASASFELRAVDEAARTFEGYASTFGGTPDSYGDIVAPGAFRRTLKERGERVVMLWQHDQTKPIGLWTELREDDRGLFVRGQIVDTALGRDAYLLLKAGALSGLSIGFRTVQSRIDPDELTRILTDVELYEISLVSMPANDAARVSQVRSASRSSLSASLDLFEARMLARHLRTLEQLAAIDALVARLTPAPPAEPPASLPSIHQRAAEYQARMAHYVHHHL